MWRKIPTAVVVASVVLGVATQAAAQSKAAKIRSAMAAAPASIAKNATIMDYPDASGKMATLREGSKPVALKGVGYSYMLSYETWESNTDAAAKGPTADNQWHHVPGNLMIAYPDKAMLAGLPTRPSLNGPYVMYADTPYAHVMWLLK